MRKAGAEAGQDLGRFAQIAGKGAGAKVAADVGFDHGAGDFPDVQLRRQRPGDAFDHDHGALQQDQLGPGFHAETFGHIEQIGQQPPHGDLGRIHAEDRFADGPKGAGEFVNVLIGGDIAGFEMDHGDAHVIALDEPI